MQYVSVLIAVTDMERAKRFYHDVLDRNVVADFGANVTLDGGICLQTLDTWAGFIDCPKEEIVLKSRSGELYFETGDIDAFTKKLSDFSIAYVHPLCTHPWGQRVIRFYDPDGHIIEVGEQIASVVKRFILQGLSIEETAHRMDVPIEFIQSSIKQ